MAGQGTVLHLVELFVYRFMAGQGTVLRLVELFVYRFMLFSLNYWNKTNFCHRDREPSTVLYKKLGETLLGKAIPQAFNSFAVGVSGYGTMGALYGFR